MKQQQSYPSMSQDEKIAHLNLMLQTIIKVHQEMARETEASVLIKSICDVFVEGQGYNSAWIALVRDDKVISSAQAGVHGDIEHIDEMLSSPETAPHCIAEASLQNEPIAILEPSEFCKGCPLKNGYHDAGIMSAPLRHKGKTYGFFTVSIPRALMQENDERQLFLEVSKDITYALYSREKARLWVDAEKNLQSQLLHAQKLESVGQLASGIAHEINTPVQYVGSNVQFLQEAFEDISSLIGKFTTLLQAVKNQSVSDDLINDIEGCLDEIDWDYLAEDIPATINQSQEGVRRVSTIVRAMKEFSHPGNKEKEPADLKKIIETTITVARNEWKYVADVTTHFDPDLPLVPCLSDEMGQVVLNLLVNAAHAIAAKLGKNSEGEKGRITISTQHYENCIEVRICDDGAGIPEKDRNRIFEPFFTTKKIGKGTGQGLAIAYDVITQKHSGTISFETETGEGTTFILTLPTSE